jgi:uncharacterized protein DUF1707
VSQVPSPELRISDSDREAALTALGEHLSAGRLDIDEYGERSAKVTAAKTRGELAEVFIDLPEPDPMFGVRPAAAVETAKPPGELTGSGRAFNHRIAAALVPLCWMAGIVLFFTVGGWWWLALPFVLTAVGRACGAASGKPTGGAIVVGAGSFATGAGRRITA